MNLLFYHWTTLPRRKVQDSNLWRCYPQRLAIFCITTLPTFRVLDFPIKGNWNGEIWTHDFCVISTALYHWVTFHYVPLMGNDPTLHRPDVSYKKTTLWGRFLSVWVQHTYLKLLYQVEPYVTVPTARAIGMVGFEPTISRLSAVCIRPLCYIPEIWEKVELNHHCQRTESNRL